MLIYDPKIAKPASFYMLNTAFLSLPFVLFRLKEYKSIIICIGFAVLYFFSFKYLNIFLHLDNASDFYSTEIFDTFSYVITSFLIFFGFVYLKRTGDIYQKKVFNLLNETQCKNEQLEQQKEEILVQKEQINNNRNSISQKMDTILLQNNEIIQSILYAQKIQSAILPNEEELSELFSNYFIYFRPKDIVSGDFYWTKKKGNIISIAVCDCTGHGVPGGFLSMLCTAYLNEISHKYIDNPAQILEVLRTMIIDSLHQTGKVGDNHDGMDMSFCTIDKEKKTITYAGANSPAVYIRDNDIQILKPDRIPVSYYTDEKKNFTNKTIKYKDNDVFYLFTDGYTDQFGGNNRKKYRLDRFKELLLSMNNENLEKQKLIIKSNHIEWKKGNEQVDDILVVGFQV